MRLVVAVFLGLLLLSNQAWSAPPSADADKEAARLHYKRAMVHYDLGRYDQAISEFQLAYEIKNDPILLFNIAQAHRLAMHYIDALNLYKNYLRRSPDAQNRLDVLQRIGELEEIIAKQNRLGQQPLPHYQQPVPPQAAPLPVPVQPVVLPQKNVASVAPAPVVTAPAPPVTPPPAATVEPRVEPQPPPPTPRAVQPSPAATAEPAGTDVNLQAPASSPTENDSAVLLESNLHEGLISPEATAHDLAERQGQGKVIGGAVMVVLGLGMVAGGITCGVLASNMSNKQERSAVFLPDTESTGKTLTTLGIVLDVVGGALAVSGLAVAIIGTKQKKAATRAAFVPMMGPGLMGGNFHLQF